MSIYVPCFRIIRCSSKERDVAHARRERSSDLVNCNEGLPTVYASRSFQGSGLGDSDFRVLEALLHKGPLPVDTIGPKVFLTPDHGNEGLQGITVEDSMSMVHLSYGMKHPCSPHLRSESAIIAGIAKASLPKTATPWEEYAADYNRLRDKMAEAIEGFECFNRRVRQPLGFRLKQPARELVFLSGFRAIPYHLPRGCAMGYMPELNVLCPIGDYSAQSDQPLMKHVVVKISPSKPRSSSKVT
jgi:hypothetical protein